MKNYPAHPGPSGNPIDDDDDSTVEEAVLAAVLASAGYPAPADGEKDRWDPALEYPPDE